MEPSPHNPDRSEHSTRAADRAFSLIELLIVVAIIAILVALIVVGLRRVQVAAARTDSANALRQMMAGYLGYSGDNNNTLMPGYVDFDASTPKALFSLNARLANGNLVVPVNQPGQFTNQHRNINSYVWRLSPYLSHNWRTMMVDYRDRGTLGLFEGQVGNLDVKAGAILGPANLPGGSTLPTVASAPSFGLNSIFFGGDSLHTNFDFSSDHDWTNPDFEPKRVATRTSQIRNARAIVFAPAGMAVSGATDENPYIDDAKAGMRQRGYPELRPPYIDYVNGNWTQQQWKFGKGGRIEPGLNLSAGNGAGLPITRRNPRERQYPVAFFDGSAEIVDIGEIAEDMRFWSPFQTGITSPP